MDVLNQLFSTFKVSSEVFHNGQYCGNWAVDTSGLQYMNFHIVSHGECYLTVGDNPTVYNLEEGDMVLFPKDIKHCMTNDNTFSQTNNANTPIDFSNGKLADATGLICGYFAHSHPMFSNITQFLPNVILLKKITKTETPSSLSYLIAALLQESLSAKPGAKLVMNKMAEALLAIIFRQHLPADKGIVAALLHPKLGPAIQAIHASPAKTWTVDAMAEIAFLSRAGFSNLFKSVLNQTPIDYVTQWRMCVAYRMLADEKSTTLETAIAVGYDNESSFSKAFKRILGVNPGSVRTDSKALI
ncbi:AraC family transcriptional regulator [uncultured Paraglaciecola sp.]|uniref:AraC family transcriptional regulator n=1 Tax=uncultured Paraglaciecola sp. TaxID=1765024 RepID=UPI0025CF7774|nr:AraC family transcriptional regulator [uncultured Paraglaciecola sp.]